MAVLESCPKHNMVAYLEKTDGNAEFHEIIDFLARSSIHHALTVSPVVSTTFVEQFWMSAKSKIINNVRYITAKVAGKPVSISEASIRSDLLFDDADGIHSLPNQAIFEDSGGNHGGQSSSDRSLSGNEGDMTLQSDMIFVSLCVSSTSKDCQLVDKEKVSTDRSKVSTDRSKVSTDKVKVSTDRPDEGTDDQTEGRNDPQTPPTTTTPFGDDETIAQVLIIMSQNKEKLKEKEKGVELKDVEETERPRPTSTRSLLTLKPLPKIDPKDKGKKKIEEEDESDTESEGIPEAEKKFKQLARDEEMARKVQEDWEAEEEVKKLAEEEAINAALSNEYDFIQARIEADRLLALRLQDEEREQFNVEERAKFLHDTIAAQRRFLAEQRAIAIRNKPPTRTQLRNQMMTYLKHVGNKKHSDLKNKTFEEIQALYEKVKRVKDPDRKYKERGLLRKSKERWTITEKSDVDSEDEHRKCLKIVPLDSKIDIEVMETKSVIARLNKVSSPDGDYLVIYRANGNFRAFNCLLEVLHIFDRQDLFHLYDLVMEQYSEITLEGIELILWGDLKIMMESSQEENDQSDFWDDQQDWEIVTWRLYEACGVYILELKDGTVIHMLVEKRYPLSKDLLQRMLDLGLEVKRESTATLDLIRFIKQ
ncbi:hypothetical protein Tco_0058923 [Tanacetum coccineum]